MIKLVAIGGSLRASSFTYHVLEMALKKITSSDIQIDLIDLRQLNLPFCNGETDYPHYPDVTSIRQQIKSAHGLLIATPEYHGSMSGVLKNTLDLLNEEHLRGKIVGLIAIVGGIHSTNALNNLRVIFRHLNCWVLPEQVIIPYAYQQFDEKGCFKDVTLEKRLTFLVNHLVFSMRKLGIHELLPDFEISETDAYLT